MEPQRKDNIRDRLVLGADTAERQAKELHGNGLHQQAAEERAKAKIMRLVLTWIDNGLPLDSFSK